MIKQYFLDVNEFSKYSCLGIYKLHDLSKTEMSTGSEFVPN